MARNIATASSDRVGRSVSSSASTMPLTSVGGGSRSSFWKCTVPRYLPVGVAVGGRHTYTCAARAGFRSGRRISASASATVASGGTTTGAVVISPPAEWSG